MKRTRIEMKAIPQLNNEVRVWDRLQYHTTRHTLKTVEVQEYDARHAPVELTIAMLKHVYGW